MDGQRIAHYVELRVAFITAASEGRMEDRADALKGLRELEASMSANDLRQAQDRYWHGEVGYSSVQRATH
jgi:hypothetical protein